MGKKYVGTAASNPSDLITLAQLTGLKATTVSVINVVTGSESRPTSFQMIIWLGGATRPTNMTNGDIWFSTETQTTPVAPAITTAALNTMTNGVAFTQTLVVTGTAPITFAVTSGALPSWASLNTSNGTISGTPNATGAYDFTITASNSVGSSTARRYQGTVAASGTAPVITTTTLPAMTQNTAYASGVLAFTGSTPVTFGVTTGTLPTGLSISSTTGEISGTPTVSGAYSFTVTATNSFGSDPQAYSGTITAASATTANIFGNTMLNTGTASAVNTDGGGSLRAGNRFYTSRTGGIDIVGVRVYTPASASTAHRNLSLTVYGYLDDWTGSDLPAGTTYGKSPVATKVYSTARTAGGWVDILFDSPVHLNKIAASGTTNDLFSAVVAYSGGNDYVVVTGISDQTQSAAAPNADVHFAETSGVGRSIHNIGAGGFANNSIYNTDIIFVSA